MPVFGAALGTPPRDHVDFPSHIFLFSPFTGDGEDLFSCSDDDEYHAGNNDHVDSMSGDDKDLFASSEDDKKDLFLSSGSDDNASLSNDGSCRLFISIETAVQ